MRFLKRHQYVLVFLAVLVFCSVMVVRQYIANQWAHTDLREDFILLHDKGQAQQTARLYQILVQQLPRLSDRALLDDFQRTAMLIDPKPGQQEDLVWKYHFSVRNELERRSELRLARAHKRAESE